jgi:hypothetical protein
MRDLERWSNVVGVFGGMGLVVGSLDPLEGSALIVLGSALLALGSYLGREDRRILAYRTWSFILIALGVGAMFGLSAIGGVGGNSGHSAWWALLILPYLVGWSLDIWGPGAPRWVSVAGIAVGAWYVAILGRMLWPADHAAHPKSSVPAIMVAVVGIGTIVACAFRLRKDPPAT